MKEKPTSYGHMLKTTALVEHSALTQADRHVLLALALYADGNTGRRTWPGKKKLAKVTGYSSRWITERLDFLESQGLIQTMAHAKGGRGNATEYRLCFESPAYLDDADERVNPSSSFTDEKGEVGFPKGCTGVPERVNWDTEKGEVEFTPSDSSSENPSNPPSEQNPESGRMDSSNPKPSAMSSERKAQADEFFAKDFDLMGSVSDPQRKQIEQLAVRESPDHPWELMKEVMRRFKLRPKGFVGLTDTWGWFLRETPHNIGKVKEDSWWRERFDPAYKDSIELALANGKWDQVRSTCWGSRFPLNAELEEFKSKERFADVTEARRALSLFYDWRKQADAWEKENPEPEIDDPDFVFLFEPKPERATVAA